MGTRMAACLLMLSSLFSSRAGEEPPVTSGEAAVAQADSEVNAFLRFVRQQATTLPPLRPPTTLAAWQQRRELLRQQLQEAWGAWPVEPCALEPRVLGILTRDGYRVEKVIFQTLPETWMTANVYVPDNTDRAPAVLCVHGHWPGAADRAAGR